MASLREWFENVQVCSCLHSPLVLYAVSVWVDVSDRKASRGLSAITILCLDDSSRSALVAAAGGGWRGGGLFFSSSSPLGPLHYSKDTYWALHFLVHLWHQARLANQSKKRKKKTERKKEWEKTRKTGSQPLKIHSELSVAHPSPSCSN